MATATKKIGNSITKMIVYTSGACLLAKCVFQFFMTLIELL